jgi:hypothetical protein
MSSRRFCVAVLSLGVLLLMPFLYVDAQSTYGSISGTVTDQSGAAVTGASVNLTNVGTSEKRTETSGDDGHFTFVNLFPGQYRIDVEKQGFKHFGRPGITVQVQQDAHIDAPLTVGQVTETVEVSADVPLLQSESSSLGQVVEQRKADELPLNGRNIFNLITVSPAAVAQGGSGGSPVGQNPFSWGNYQVGGSFANQARLRRRIQSPIQQPGCRVGQVLRRRSEPQHKVGNERMARIGVRVFPQQGSERQRILQ